MSDRTTKHEDSHTVWGKIDGIWCKRCERFLCEKCVGKGCAECAGTGITERMLGEPRMTAAEIQAIEQVLLVNSDICALYEKRGVSRDDLREVFMIAKRHAADSSAKE